MLQVHWLLSVLAEHTQGGVADVTVKDVIIKAIQVTIQSITKVKLKHSPWLLNLAMLLSLRLCLALPPLLLLSLTSRLLLRILAVLLLRRLRQVELLSGNRLLLRGRMLLLLGFVIAAYQGIKRMPRHQAFNWQWLLPCQFLLHVVGPSCSST